MLRLEAMNFIDDQMQARWPDWKPTAEQIADWAVWLGPYTFETARNAVREHIGSSRFNKRPNAAALRSLLAKFQPRKEQEKTEQPEPAVFVMYEGGGRGTMLAGYFFPIITLPGVVVTTAAQHMRGKHKDGFGGTWKVYAETTHSEMTKIRREFHKRRVNAAPDNSRK